MNPSRRRRASSQLHRPRRRGPVRAALAAVQARWLSLACALALAWLTGILLTHPRFRVAQVVVLHSGPSAQAALTRAHQVSHVVGYNIFLLSTGRLAEAIASVPSVKRARVRPELPDVVAIELEERQPVALWRTPSITFLVDDEGQIIAEAGERRLPLSISDTSGRPLVPGDRVERRILLVVRELQQALPRLGATPREIEYTPTGLSVVTEAGWRVLFGDLDELNRKLAYLAAITDLAQRQKLRLALVDLRPRDRPYYQVQS